MDRFLRDSMFNMQNQRPPAQSFSAHPSYNNLMIPGDELSGIHQVNPTPLYGYEMRYVPVHNQLEMVGEFKDQAPHYYQNEYDPYRMSMCQSFPVDKNIQKKETKNREIKKTKTPINLDEIKETKKQEKNQKRVESKSSSLSSRENHHDTKAERLQKIYSINFYDNVKEILNPEVTDFETSYQQFCRSFSESSSNQKITKNLKSNYSKRINLDAPEESYINNRIPISSSNKQFNHYGFGDGISNKSRPPNKTTQSRKRLTEYKKQAVLVERRVKERNNAAIIIQKAFRRYLLRLNSKIKAYQAFVHLQRLAGMICYKNKIKTLRDLKYIANEINYGHQVKIYLNQCASKIQRKWRGLRDKQDFRAIFTDLSRSDFEICEKLIKGFKTRKILKLKELFILKQQVNDLQKTIKGWFRYPLDYRDLIEQTLKDIRRKKIKFINQFYKYYYGNWSWVFYKKEKETNSK